MSLLTPFVRRRENTPPVEETYIEVAARFPVAVAPQLPPEAPIQSLTPNTRRAKMPKTFFFHPHSWEEENFLTRGARIRPGAFVPNMAQHPWGNRFNVRRPVPEPFGSRFELGG